VRRQAPPRTCLDILTGYLKRLADSTVDQTEHVER
jgi:hypothetical protein